MFTTKNKKVVIWVNYSQLGPINGFPWVLDFRNLIISQKPAHNTWVSEKTGVIPCLETEKPSKTF